MRGAEREETPVDRPAPIRRVLITADAVGGVWPYTLHLASALRQRGLEITIAVMGPGPSERQRAAAGALATLVCHPGRLEWMDDPWDGVQAAGAWLLDLAERTRPDLVHLNGYCHASLPWRAPVLVVAHSCVCSWWSAVQGTEPPARFDRYRGEVARGLTSARVVIAPTRAMLAALRREYGPTAEAHVIPNGLPGLSGADDGPKEPFVLTAGRLWDEGKNIRSLCDVAANVPWPIYVAGSGTDPDGRCVQSWSVHHLGQLDPVDLSCWFRRAAIYALPARYEPFGLSVLEAAAAGCALVLGDIPSLRENWSGAAAFVPPDNRRALAGALRRLIEDEAERTRLGAAARSRAARFDLHRMAESYLAAYRRAIGRAVVPAHAALEGAERRGEVGRRGAEVAGRTAEVQTI